MKLRSVLATFFIFALATPNLLAQECGDVRVIQFGDNYNPGDFTDPGDEGTTLDGPDANVKKVEIDRDGNNWHHSYSLYPGESFQTQVKITNKGDETIDYYEVFIHRSTDKDFNEDADYSYGREEEDTDVAPGGSDTKHRSATAPGTPGTYYLFAYINRVDGKSGGVDQDWSNNYSRNDDPEEYAVLTVLTPPPTADFSFSPTSGTVPLKVTFTNKSKFADSYMWTFGDGSASNVVSPVYTYTKAGTYTVSLKASSALGSSTKTASVKGLAAPPPQSFTITSPNSKSNWRCEKDSQYKDIKWTSQNISKSEPIAIYYTYDGGSTWRAVDTDTTNDGIKHWYMCKFKTKDSKNCYIKIVLKSNPAVYAISQKFAIDHASGCD